MMERFERKKFTERFDYLVAQEKKNVSPQLQMDHDSSCWHLLPFLYVGRAQRQRWRRPVGQVQK